MDYQSLQAKAHQIRKNLVRVAIANNVGHIAPALSCVDILVALYYSVMHKDDLCILSKGHGALALYAILNDLGKIPNHIWERFELPGCLERNDALGIPCSTGSLGHGLPIAAGMAFARRHLGKPGNIYCVCGDGEFIGEGSCSEAMNFIFRTRLKNITVIIDNNRLQAMGPLPMGLRYSWPNMRRCNGHNMKELVTALNKRDRRLLAAETIKGKGIRMLEGIASWHYRLPKTATELLEVNSFLSSKATPNGS